MKSALVLASVLVACGAERPISIGSAASTTHDAGAGGALAAGTSVGTAGTGGAIVISGGGGSSGAITAGAPSGGAAGSGGACVVFLPPTSTASCSACDSGHSNCQENGCFDGFWCNPAVGACTAATAVTACESGGIATTCDASNGTHGCCAPNGDVYFCDDDGDEIETKDCDAGTCGWDADHSRYACGTDGSADPSGTYPKSCGP